MEQTWNHVMEACFGEFLDRPCYDKTEDAIFQLVREAFAEGYRVGVSCEQGKNILAELKKTHTENKA